MEAKDILSRVAKIYAEAQSYRDEGSLTVTRGAVDKPGMIINFKTHFKRPNFYRFETTQQTRSSTNRYVIWCDGKSVARQSNQFVQHLSEHFIFKNTTKDLDRALSTMQEAQPIAYLLFDKLTGKKITDMPEIKLVGQELCAGQNCFHLQAEAHNDFMDLWVSSLSFAIAKLVERQLVADNQDTLKVSGVPQRAKKIPVVSEFNFTAVAINDNFPNGMFQIPANTKG